MYKTFEHMDAKNISLIGFMASGKSTAGKLLAKKLGMLFIDLDRVIELKDGKSVADIFKQHGERYFRDMESAVIKKIYQNKNCVFACGGGVVERGENIDIIKDASLVVYLKVSPRQVLDRVGEDRQRPLLNVSSKKEKVQRLLEKREPTYRKAADILVDTGNLEPQEVVKTIMEKMK